MSFRHQQIEATLKRALQQVLGYGLEDPRAEGTMITVTGISISPDLKNATCLVSIFPDERQKLALHALRHAESHVRHEVADIVAMKSVPAIRFDLDTSIKKQSEVLAALAKVAAERQNKPADPAAGPDPSTPDAPADRPGGDR